LNPAVTKLKKPGCGKLKGVQWTRVPPALINNTVFAQFQNLDRILDEMPYEVLENEFNPKKSEEGASTEKKKVSSQIIDGKTAQTVAILLKGFKGKTIPEIVESVVQLDERVFEVGVVNALIKCLPSKDDIQNIKEYLAKDETAAQQLGTAEIFALEMNKVSMAEEKLKAFASKLAFPNRLSDLKADVKTIELACTQVMSSRLFRQILEYVLMFGNFLNSGTPRAGIPGFKVGALSKLKDTKTADGKRTMIHIIVSFVEQKHPELVTFGKELELVHDATKVAGSTLEADINSLGKAIKEIEASVGAVTASEIPDKQPFLDIMTSFLERAKEDHAALKAQHQEMAAKYTDLCKFFGEDLSKPLTPEEMFTELFQFIDTWAKAAEENVKARETAEREARLAAQKEKRLKEKDKEKDHKKQHGTPLPGAAGLGKDPLAASANHAVVDELMSDVLAGQAFTSRRARKPKV
jgi:hypothetical protein